MIAKEQGPAMKPTSAADAANDPVAATPSEPERIGVYVAWPYANGPLHVGHIGGSLLPPDIFARYHRLRGAEVMMVSGSDTHGTPIAVRAEAEGISPAEVVRTWHGSFLDTFMQLGIGFDLFTHTDTENHHRVAKALFGLLRERGFLVVRSQPQLYSPSRERYLPDRFVEGTCPHCDYDSARGDQCDHCGRLLNATDLINPRARFGEGEALEIVEREHFFLDLPAFADEIGPWLEGQQGWRAAVQNSSIGLLREGLEQRAITRDMDWGIAVPVEGWQDKVLYVWFEAVMGYLSATLELAALRGQPESWRDWWFEAAAGYYFMGKDNTIFHSIMWPAILIGAAGFEGGDEHDESSLNLPNDVVANEYVNFEGGSMSTSRNLGVWLPDYLERYDPDPLRYFLTINAPETRDVDFTWRDFVRANNNELLANWGNLVNRVLKLTWSRCEGRVPEPGPLDEADRAILAATAAAFDEVGERIADRRFKIALADAMNVARDVNRYLNDQAPWKQIKEDPARGRTTLYVALRAIDDLKTVLAPFMPHLSQRTHEQLGHEGEIFGTMRIEQVEDERGSHRVLRYDGSEAVGRWRPGSLAPGQALREPSALVNKLDEAAVLSRELGESTAAASGDSAPTPE
jgi:methionyl-tRNA synthetase